MDESKDLIVSNNKFYGGETDAIDIGASTLMLDDSFFLILCIESWKYNGDGKYNPRKPG